MKLYIYRFWRNKFFFEEVDVEEKPKMYIITKNCKFGYKGQGIRKGEIGALSGYNRNKVILTEKDKKKLLKCLLTGRTLLLRVAEYVLKKKRKPLRLSKRNLKRIIRLKHLGESLKETTLFGE